MRRSALGAAGRNENQFAEGQLEGLDADVTARARIVPADGESLHHHAGYLLGRFVTWVESTGRGLDREVVRTASSYFAALSSTAAHGQWDPADTRLPAHTYGMVAAERDRGGPVPVATESLLISWLTAHAGMRPTPDAGRMLGRRRARRHARLFPDAPPD